MKLLTLNTHSLIEKNYHEKCRIFADAVAKEKPDIIALQEVNQNSLKRHASTPHGYTHAGNIPLKADNHVLLVHNLLKERGLFYHFSWAGIKNGFLKYDEGLAIMSLAPIEKSEFFYISKSHSYRNWRTRGVLISQIGGFSVCSVHFGWWEDTEEPFLYQWQTLKNTIVNQENVLLMGDFNSPSAIRNEGYDEVLKSGYFDTYTLAEIKDTGYTVKGKIAGWNDKADKKRIDYIFSDKKLSVSVSRVIFNGNNYPVVSDHFGVLTEIKED